VARSEIWLAPAFAERAWTESTNGPRGQHHGGKPSNWQRCWAPGSRVRHPRRGVHLDRRQSCLAKSYIRQWSRWTEWELAMSCLKPSVWSSRGQWRGPLPALCRKSPGNLAINTGEEVAHHSPFSRQNPGACLVQQRYVLLKRTGRRASLLSAVDWCLTSGERPRNHATWRSLAPNRPRPPQG
jgi:hypothetical protein